MPSGGDIRITEAYFRIDRKDLALFKFLLEGYDGLATVTTVDADATCVRVSAISACIAEVEEIISAIKQEFLFAGLEPVDAKTFSIGEAQ